MEQPQADELGQGRFLTETPQEFERQCVRCWATKGAIEFTLWQKGKKAGERDRYCKVCRGTLMRAGKVKYLAKKKEEKEQKRQAKRDYEKAWREKRKRLQAGNKDEFLPEVMAAAARPTISLPKPAEAFDFKRNLVRIALRAVRIGSLIDNQAEKRLIRLEADAILETVKSCGIVFKTEDFISDESFRAIKILIDK